MANMSNRWKIHRLEDLTERIIVGLATSVTKYYRETGIPIIRNQNIKKGYFDDSDILYLDPDFALSHPNKIVKSGDVITVRTGANIGLTCVVPTDFDQAHTFTTLIITPDSTALDSNYLSYFVNSKQGVKELMYWAVGAGKQNLNTNDYKKYRIPLPPLAEQKAIAQILGTWDEAIQVTEAVIDALGRRKQGLMQRLLTGEVRFPEFEGEWDEVALGEIANMQSGGTPSTSIEEYWEGDIPWITGADFGKMVIANVRRYITAGAVENSSTKVIPKGDILLVSRTGVGKIAIAPFDVVGQSLQNETKCNVVLKRQKER